MGAACRAIPAITSHQLRGRLLRNARSSGIVPRGRPDFGPYFSWSESRDGPRFLHVAGARWASLNRRFRFLGDVHTRAAESVDVIFLEIRPLSYLTCPFLSPCSKS
jgi:hypothetical protein